MWPAAPTQPNQGVCLSLNAPSSCLLVLVTPTVLSLALIGKCCDMANSFSYKDMGKRALGKTTGYIVQGVVAGCTLACVV